jgi:DNA replication and repair protein RecF
MNDIFQSSISELEIYNFRNHNFIKFTDLKPESVVITGKNGIGKTNILEAISLLSQSKGLRGAKISELNNQDNAEHVWRVTAQIRSVYGLKEIVTHRVAKQTTDTRAVLIDGQAIRKKNELNALLNIVWLTPPMQQLFTSSSSSRRIFFDQIVNNFFPQHAIHLSQYDKAMKERLKLLKAQCNDNYWLAALEQNMFNSAIEISDARMKTLSLLNQAIDKNESPFPKAILNLLNEPIPANYLDILKRNRGLDYASGRTNIGPHLYDLEVTYIKKNMLARLCSTGEQKALLLNIVLAQVYALIEKTRIIPILLFDEIISHLDSNNRQLLFEQVLNIGAQTWFTGLDPKSFEPIKMRAKFMHLEDML